MTLRSAILTFRINRFETTVIVAATLASVVVSAAVIAWMTSSGYRTCLTDDGSSFSTLCQGSFGQWMSRIARMSMTVVPIFPFAAGLLIGGPLIARELESGTARLAWSLSPSRIRWFAQRALPALALVAAAALVIGLTSEALFRTTNPSMNLDESFVGFRGRGALVALEALVVATVALALGSILGRMVPTFVLSLVLAAGIGVAIDKVESDLLLGEAAIGDSQTFMFNGGDMYLSSRFRLSDGTIASWEQLVAIHPEIEYQGFEEGPGSEITTVTMYIPGSRYHDIERREAMILIGVAGLFAAAAAVVVMRRRPR
jgi:ABC-type transport system involved in multi-copper enzyme maturation permease subunit